MEEVEQAETEVPEVGAPVEESAPPEEKETIVDQEGTAADNTDEPEKAQSAFQKRINKVTADKYREKNRADGLEMELDQLKQSQVQVAGPPSIEDFDYDEEAFMSARISYEVSRETSKIAVSAQEQENKAVRAKAANDFAKRVAETGIEDYSEVINTLVESVPLSGDIVSAIQKDEKGPQLAYYLGKHLDVADQIANKSPIEAAIELGKLSARISATKTKKTTSALDPVKPAGGGGPSSTKSYEDMSMAEVMSL